MRKLFFVCLQMIMLWVFGSSVITDDHIEHFLFNMESKLPFDNKVASVLNVAKLSFDEEMALVGKAG